MLDWFYNRLADSMISRLEVWLSDPKNIEQLTNLADSLADREIKRVIMSVTASQKGGVEGVEQPGIGIESLLSGRGGLSSKKLVGLGIQWWLNKQKVQSGANRSALP